MREDLLNTNITSDLYVFSQSIFFLFYNVGSSRFTAVTTWKAGIRESAAIWKRREQNGKKNFSLLRKMQDSS